MKEHAKSIWQAWLDEKEVQYYAQFGEYSTGASDREINAKWINADPSNPELFTPQECPHRWRIKPDHETPGFRVYWDKEYDKPNCCQFFHHQSLIEERSYFGGWLTDWIPYEVEEEE
jgi:hypothetical protein